VALQIINGPFIRAGQSLSEGLDCSGCIRIVRVTMPGNWQAAPLSFQVSTDGAMYNDLFHLQVTAGSYIPFEVVFPGIQPGVGLVLPEQFGAGATWIKFRSGTRSTPIKQDMEREFAVAVEVDDG
jgi:hypothetical protein